MVQWLLKSKRKPTGGLLKRHMKKKKYQRGRDYLPAHIGNVRTREKRTKGGGEKLIVLSTNFANVSIAGKSQKTKILSVIENAANPQYVRRNIITKGAIVKIHTDSGEKLAKVTSRPGQDGAVNAVVWHGKLKAEKEEESQKKEKAKEPKHEEKHKEHEKKAHKEHKIKEK